ncbi:phytanoyl-CoA dioxygenase domain-containing protein 1-like [Hydractinia symbiolongicarpus]|uniref:phytanoyl-CoA dioxygenase domain-containing protein 1-like n=1 Tax=Hydractinia symbiolongicarpus TaxID=13093 RepID=UPI002551AAF9|nr:phytanoyl-CoA dioxygenase domain-containing protein 1-like [Hydractinia symbiolongicarpus]
MPLVTTEVIEQFQKTGYSVLENLLSPEECDQLRSKSKKCIEDLDMQTHPKTIFSTENQNNDKYFIESQDKIRFFFEENVFDDKGNLTREKQLAINKIGHGLHYVDDDYKSVTHHAVVQEFFKKANFNQPVIVQSMVIFKQPQIGGVVLPHQDATFLMTSPSKVMGVWIALEDADLENGCLWFIPGSHTRAITRKMIRNPDKNGPITIFTNPPDEFDDSQFVAVPVKKGSAVIIHGHVVHKSEKNLSTRSREIYTYHVAESHNTEWCAENWLQPSGSYQFPKLYT